LEQVVFEKDNTAQRRVCDQFCVWEQRLFGLERKWLQPLDNRKLRRLLASD